jgi:hypothetical protein
VEFDGYDDAVYAGTFSVSPTITMAAWIKADDFGTSDARIVSKATGTANNQHYWMLSTISSGGIKLRFRLKTSGSTTSFNASSGSLSSDVWTHVAATWDGYYMMLFKNGTEVGSAHKEGTINTSGSVGVAVGNQPSGAGDKPFDGLIDDVRIYDRSLSEAQLTALTNMDTADCNFVNTVYDPNSDADDGFFDAPLYP